MSPTKTILLSIILLFSSTISAQSKSFKTLKKEYKKANEPVQKAEAALEIGYLLKAENNT